MTDKERIKQIRIETDPTVKGKRLESHHVEPKFQNKDSEYQFALTLPEHARIHKLMAEKEENWKDAKINYWATGKIVSRMTPDELKDFNDQITKR